MRKMFVAAGLLLLAGSASVAHADAPAPTAPNPTVVALQPAKLAPALKVVAGTKALSQGEKAAVDGARIKMQKCAFVDGRLKCLDAGTD